MNYFWDFPFNISRPWITEIAESKTMEIGGAGCITSIRQTRSYLRGSNMKILERAFWILKIVSPLPLLSAGTYTCWITGHSLIPCSCPLPTPQAKGR